MRTLIIGADVLGCNLAHIFQQVCTFCKGKEEMVICVKEDAVI